jgi:hypothetical protein
MAAVLAYAADVSTVLTLLLMLPATATAARDRVRRHRRHRYRARHALPGRRHRGRHRTSSRPGLQTVTIRRPRAAPDLLGGCGRRGRQDPV